MVIKDVGELTKVQQVQITFVQYKPRNSLFVSHYCRHFSLFQQNLTSFRKSFWLCLAFLFHTITSSASASYHQAVKRIPDSYPAFSQEKRKTLKIFFSLSSISALIRYLAVPKKGSFLCYVISIGQKI